MKFRFLFSLFLLFVVACKPSFHVQKSESAFYTPSATDTLLKDTLLLKLIYPYQKDLKEKMDEVLATSHYPMEKGLPESRLGNFVADLSIDVANQLYHPEDSMPIDFCVLNNGSLRSSLPQGSIRKRHVFELMPFENELVVITLSADSTKALFNYIAEKGGVPVSNLRLKINTTTPEQIYIGTEPFNDKRNYKVLTSDYLALGGDFMTMFMSPLKFESVGIKLRDAIIKFMIESNRRQPFIEAETDERISR